MVLDGQELRDVLKAKMAHLVAYGIEHYHGRELAKIMDRLTEIADEIEKADITKAGLR